MKKIRLKKVPKRYAANHQLVLRVLQSASAPMTAYEILHALRQNGFYSPTTVYRAVKRLMDSGQVHRLESINAYLSCSNNKHHQGPMAFAICRGCGHVDEFVGGALTKQLKANATQHGFRVEAAVIELKGKCASCARNRTAGMNTGTGANSG
jgi:Fur family zinc uptake transcriptional regulator